MSVLPILPLAMGLGQATAQAIDGDLTAAAATTADSVIGEVPIVGDILQPDSLANGEGGMERTQYELQNRNHPLPSFVAEPPVDPEAIAQKRT